MKKALIPALLALATCGLAQRETFPVQKQMGKKMIPFAMSESTGDKVTNTSIKGKVTIIDFWATWCGPCRMMSSILEQFYSHYHSAGLQIYGADAGEARDGDIEKWLIYHPHPYPITLRNDGLAAKLKINSFPTALVIDKKGVVRSVIVGVDRRMPYQLDALVQKLLAEKG